MVLIMSHVLTAKKVLLLQKHTSSVNSVMKVWITPLQGIHHFIHSYLIHYTQSKLESEKSTYNA
jgi:hypothetical protein